MTDITRLSQNIGNNHDKFNERLEKIFAFLTKNRQYNRSLQEKIYQSIILPYSNTTDKIASLLYHVANTQSQPKIDSLASFYQSVLPNPHDLSSMQNFIEKIIPNKPINFESLYIGMKGQKGWGNKTSALFAKSIFHLHNGQFPDQLRVWKDVPKTIAKDDKFFLPVDTVITAIFKKLDPTTPWDFEKINVTLQSKFTGDDIEIWDDLWFWGFISQKGSGEKREFEFNKNKYWAYKETDKNPVIIEEIKEKVDEFIKLMSN